jgi:hypothetical protein
VRFQRSDQSFESYYLGVHFPIVLYSAIQNRFADLGLSVAPELEQFAEHAPVERIIAVTAQAFLDVREQTQGGQ